MTSGIGVNMQRYQALLVALSRVRLRSEDLSMEALRINNLWEWLSKHLET